MKDLRSRGNALIVLLSLLTLLGCQALEGRGPDPRPSGLLVVQPALDFGTVVVGGRRALSDRVVNFAPSSVTISNIAINRADFQLTSPKLPITLAPGQSTWLGLSFSPQAAGNPSATVMISSNAPNASITVSLTGLAVSPGDLTVSPSIMSFGNVKVGDSQTKSGSFRNTGGSNLILSSASVSGSEFKLSGVNLPMILAPAQSAAFRVTFTPKTDNGSSGMISVTTYASLRPPRESGTRGDGFNPGGTGKSEVVTVPLNGNGFVPGQLGATPSSLAFGNVQVGANKTLSETLTNVGGENIIVSQATVTGAGFSVTGLSLPLTLATGQSATFSVKFAPQSAGSVTGNIALVSDGGSLDVPLTGTGIAPGSLTANPTSLSFGNVQIGNSSTLSETLTNSGGSTVTISQANITGSGFSISGLSLPLTLTAGQSKTFSVIFAPQSAGNASGNLAVVSDASNPTLNIPLSGTGVTPGSLTANPASLAFGNVQVGNNQTLSETLTNTGGSSVTISQANVTGTGFSLSGLSLPLTLTAGQSKTFSVVFSPQSAGAVTGSIAIVSNVPTLNIPLSGTGVAPGSLTANPASLSFGNVQIGDNQTLSETLTNSGGASVTISQATVTGSGFSVSGLTLPLTLAAGQSKTFSVIFAPQSAGAVSGNVAVVSDASNSTLNVPLSGTGLTAGSLTPNPSSLSFGNVQIGNSQTLSETLTNSGGSSVTISQATVTGTGFSISGLTLPLTLAAGQSKSFSVTFTPQSAGAVSGNIAVVSDASNSTLNIPLSGTGVTAGALTANPSSLSFGNVQIGNSQTLSETLTNSGGSSVTISQATVTGSGFSLSGLTLPLTLAAGQSKSFSVVFAPQSAGAASGNIAVVSDASNPTLNIPLSGTGLTAGSLTPNPSSLSFGNVQVGNSSTLSETVTNSGGSSVTISQANVTGTGYSLTGLTLPLTLAAGQSKTFSVVFAPQSAGAVNGNLAIVSDASNSTLNIPLSGTGVTAGLLTANPSSLSFGNVQIGNSSTLSETVTNSGGSSVTISQANVTGTGYSISGLSLPLTLAAGQSKTFSVVFAPQSAGAVNGNLAIVSDASNSTLNIPLSGTGVTAGLLTANPSSLSFGNVQVGNNSSLSETMTNSGGSSVTITQANVTGTGYSISGLSLPLTLASGQSKTFTVTFAPQSAGAVSGNLAIISNASNSTLNIPLSGTGVTAGLLTANPSSLAFGNVQVGNSKLLSETLTNAGGTAVTVSQATVTGTGFSISGLSLPLTLAPGQSFTFGATFAPLSGGNASGSIAVVSDASNSTLTISLSGTGTTPGQLSVSPSSLNFGNVTVGTSKSLTSSLSASAATVTVSSVTVSTSEFAVTGLSFPVMLTAGQSTSFTVTFTPQASGVASATASFVSNASNSPTAQSLSGTGTPAPQHSVDLSWSPSPDVVVGYNVYRGTKSGGPYTKLNSALNADTTYTDMSVQAGQTYYYVTTAVDSNNMESTYSNQVQAVIPTP